MNGPLFALNLSACEPYLPHMVGAIVTFIILYIFWEYRRQIRGLLRPPKRLDGVAEDEDTFANRRSANRREGEPVRVMISSPTFRGQLEAGWVLDRSTGGLRIAVVDPIPVGATLQIRTENAPNTIPWVTIIVRSCKLDKKHHELGCSFETTPPWNVLLLFG